MSQDTRGEEDIRHHETACRYELRIGDNVASVEYARRDGCVVFTHTFVPPEFRGRGIAEKLVRRALDDARKNKAKIVPACSYVDAYVRRHPEYQPLLSGLQPPESTTP
jgi:predicted GNAT family acetyltransferase